MLYPAAPVTWLTPEAHARLQGELDHLLEARRNQPESSDRVAAEARIRQLLSLLRDVRLHSPADDGVVEPGMLIEAYIDGEAEVFLMGTREIFGDGNLDVFSEHSPLGVAIHGLKPGEHTSYQAPNGREITVSIVSAKPYTGPGTCPGQSVAAEPLGEAS